MKRKRALSILLAFLVLLPQIPAMPVQAADQIVYERQYLEYPLFNAAMKAAPNCFIENNGDSAFNVINRFTKTFGDNMPEIGVSAPDTLSFDATFSARGNVATYTFGFNPKEIELAQKGNIAVAFLATLTSNYHQNIYTHFFEERLSYPYVVLSDSAWNPIHTRMLDSDSSITIMETGNYEFKPVGNGTQGLNLYLKGEGCPCGLVSAAGMSLILADVQSPVVTDIYTTRDANSDSGVFTQFHAGEDIYIHLKFNESIRFAEDEVTDKVEAMQLNVSLKRITDQTELGGVYAVANLVSLKNDTLTFKFRVPSDFTIDNKSEPTNYYMDRIDYGKQTTWINSKPEYDLKVVYKKPGDTNPTVIPMSNKAKDADKDKATSLVVDLAGNGIDTEKSRTSLNSVCYMDNKAPSVKTVTIDRVLKNPGNNTDRGEIFTAANDTNGFWVEFDEEVILINGNNYIPITNANVGKLRAQLNIKDSSENPVVVQGSKTDPGNRAKVYFEYTIQDGDKPLVYPAAGDQPIGVNRIYSDDPAFILADTRGNQYDSATELINRDTDRILPEQQLWLDTTPPAVAAGNGVEESEGGTKYTPVNVNPRGFSFPLIISDAGSEEYASGTNGLKPSLKFLPPYSTQSSQTAASDFVRDEVRIKR